MNELTEVSLTLDEGKMILRDLAGTYQNLRLSLCQQRNENGITDPELESRSNTIASICNKILKASKYLN